MKYLFSPALLGGLLAAIVSTAACAADADSASVRFDINRFEVRGNTLLSAQAVDGVVAPFAGKQRDFADVMGALDALEAAYHKQGYQLVRIDLPEQELDHGVVTLNVVQTRIGSVMVDGNRNFTDANIRQSLPGLREGQTPDLKSISKSLKLANENPAKKTIMSLKSGTQDDEVDATLAVTDESIWTTSINLDNTGNKETGKTHAGIVLQNANVSGRDDVLSMQYTTTVEEPSRVSVYGVGYHLPLYSLGDSMDFFASYSDVDTGTVTAGIFDIAVSGQGSVYGARYNQNLPTMNNYESKLVYGVDYKAYKNSMELFGVDVGADITVHPVSVGYMGSWALAAGSADFSVTLLHNIPGGSRGRQQDFENTRFDAVDDYTALRFAASVTQALPADWQARAIINGQYTNDALVPGEQFGAGGGTSVRGFEEREVSNDSGVTGNFEVYSSPLCGNANWQCRALAFYDTSYLTRNHALPGEFRSISISSIGLGMRVRFRNQVDLQMDYGHVLHAEATETQDGDNRLHVRLALSF